MVSLFRPIALGLTLTALAGCGKALEFGGTCHVADDQKNSFMAKVEIPPVRVIVDSSFSKINGISDVQRAVDEWNRKGQIFAKRDMFRLMQGTVPEFIRNADPKKCSERVGSETQFFVVYETSQTKWSTLGLGSNIPGVTIRCTSGGDVNQQIIFINPTLIDRSQVMTVVLHELGHALGLDHSCQEGSGTQDFIGCAKVISGHPYREAVMFPSLATKGANGTGTNELKEILKENDTTRAECLYSPK